MFELSPDIISVMDAEGRLLYNSPAAERIHGYDVRDMLGQSTMAYVHPDDAAAVAAAFANLLANPSEPVIVTYRYRHRDGGWTWMEATGRNELDNPHVGGIIAVSRDISAREAERGPAGAATRPGDTRAAPVPFETGRYDPERRVFEGEGGVLALTVSEARLLHYLSVRPGLSVSTDQLLADVWGYASGVRSRTVYVTIDRLRKKVERDPRNPRCLLSTPGHGYRYQPPGPDGEG